MLTTTVKVDTTEPTNVLTFGSPAPPTPTPARAVSTSRAAARRLHLLRHDDRRRLGRRTGTPTARSPAAAGRQRREVSTGRLHLLHLRGPPPRRAAGLGHRPGQRRESPGGGDRVRPTRPHRPAAPSPPTARPPPAPARPATSTAAPRSRSTAAPTTARPATASGLASSTLTIQSAALTGNAAAATARRRRSPAPPPRPSPAATATCSPSPAPTTSATSLRSLRP